MTSATRPRVPLWTSREADAATGGRSSAPWRAGGVSIDSRTIAAGDLFVALRGDTHDGHRFVSDAFEAGAAAAMVSDKPKGIAPDQSVIEVADTYGGLLSLARASRERATARIVAVTGSVGKTGTKEMIARMLEVQGPTAASAGNLNNHLGAPLSLARMPANTAYAVFELGMNHAGEIEPLTRLVRPMVALITTVQAVHLEFFGSIEGIADAKAEIFLGVEPGGVALINAEDGTHARLSEAATRAGVSRIVSFGASPKAEARLVSWQPKDEGSAIMAEIAGKTLRYELKLAGRHWAINSVAALASIGALGADPELGLSALAGFAPMKGRGARHRLPIAGGDYELIDESYNASPAAMRAALETLGLRKADKNGRHIAVLGDMLELGPDGPRLHVELGQPILQAGIDLVFLAGPQMAELYDSLPKGQRGGYAPDSAGLARLVCQAVQAGDVVLVKGSLGSRMGVIVDSLIGEDAGGGRAGRAL
ncbi:MAG: UDP-N-acetylmuramoylalanyl-D-glutamyl-2,6-diaminopimelate--D-alanyl-D-alanine ligase [Alphaproteobacteria bacterium]|nr:UDP-N-acetylmuramoylalanyl-D-glutamyl-2,6-diaminopimelate--D-alanyl-D-alanine ligase [Alphaproteobacteria bacterium]